MKGGYMNTCQFDDPSERVSEFLDLIVSLSRERGIPLISFSKNGLKKALDVLAEHGGDEEMYALIRAYELILGY